LAKRGRSKPKRRPSAPAAPKKPARKKPLINKQRSLRLRDKFGRFVKVKKVNRPKRAKPRSPKRLKPSPKPKKLKRAKPKGPKRDPYTGRFLPKLAVVETGHRDGRKNDVFRVRSRQLTFDEALELYEFEDSLDGIPDWVTYLEGAP
jgi:hypothetical protein